MITIPSKTIVRLLICAVVGLTVANLLAQMSRYLFGHPDMLGLVRLFDVNEENNVPTWYSSTTLLFSAVLLGVITSVKAQQRDRFAKHWAGLAILFLLMAMDEDASIHELLIPLGQVFKASGALLFFWVVPGIIFVLGMLFAYSKFLIALPSKTRNLFLLAGAVFIFGSIGFEMIGAYYFDTRVNKDPTTFGTGWPALSMAVILAAEECLEMTGVLIFIHCLLSYITEEVREVQVVFRGAESRSRVASKPVPVDSRMPRPMSTVQPATQGRSMGKEIPHAARSRISH